MTMAPRVIPHGDDGLSTLLGLDLRSSSPGVVYRLGSPLGEGGMSVAIQSLRHAPEGQTATVVKLVRPSFLVARPEFARLVVEKEAAALMRLNQRIPSTPFVVRLIDAGIVAVRLFDGRGLDLPWLALEYVHGGPDGTTLTERVQGSVRWSGYAFDEERAMRAVECLTEGVSAVHEMNVIHRDLKPDNVLCCGAGDDELLKISDFGIARPAGLAGTFGGLVVGTPGYAAPEQVDGNDKRVGPATDVFALAAVVYYLLTGEDLFPVDNPMMALAAVASKERRSILASAYLDPELRARPEACREIDAILARATALRPDERPGTARRLAAELAPTLRSESRRGVVSRRSLGVTLAIEAKVDEDSTEILRRSWYVRHPGRADMTVRSVGWNSDGSCLVATTTGLSFWDGTAWHEVSTSKLPSATGVRVVQTVSPGRWMLAGDEGMMADMVGGEIRRVVQLPEPGAVIEHASGDMADLAVLQVNFPSRPPMLYAMAGHRWVRSVPLDGVASVGSMVRLSDSRWLVAGRSVYGLAYAAVYDPLMVQVHPLDVPRTPAFIAAAAHHQRDAGLMAGTGGVVAWFEDQSVMFEQLPEDAFISSVAVDVSLCGWAATSGKLWVRRATEDATRWRCVWEKSDWHVPFVSIHASAGHVVAISADGGILEGRSNAGW